MSERSMVTAMVASVALAACGSPRPFEACSDPRLGPGEKAQQVIVVAETAARLRGRSADISKQVDQCSYDDIELARETYRIAPDETLSRSELLARSDVLNIIVLERDERLLRGEDLSTVSTDAGVEG